MAVSDVSIRTRGSDLRFVRDLGAGEYTLNGVPTGVGYATPRTGNLRYYDGTSSGASSLFVDHGQYDPASGGVYIADYYWQNPQLLFYPAGICNNNPPSPPGCAGLSGIAFDPINDSLWVSAKGSTIVQEYSFGGTLLASFNAQDPFNPGYNAALGVDPADHTLWTTTGGSNFLRQYSLDPFTLGVQLQSGTPNGLPPGFYESADFQQQVPEPTSFLLVTTGITALIRFRRHHLPRSPTALFFSFGRAFGQK